MSNQQNNLQPNLEPSHDEQIEAAKRFLEESGHMVIPVGSGVEFDLGNDGEIKENNAESKSKEKSKIKAIPGVLHYKLDNLITTHEEIIQSLEDAPSPQILILDEVKDLSKYPEYENMETRKNYRELTEIVENHPNLNKLILIPSNVIYIPFLYKIINTFYYRNKKLMIVHSINDAYRYIESLES